MRGRGGSVGGGEGDGEEVSEGESVVGREEGTGGGCDGCEESESVRYMYMYRYPSFIMESDPQYSTYHYTCISH